MLTAIYKGDLTRVKFLCNSNRANLDIRYRGGSALVIALNLQKKEIADYLISVMESESLKKIEHKEAIVIASALGYFDIVSKLFEAGQCPPNFKHFLPS